MSGTYIRRLPERIRHVSGYFYVVFFFVMLNVMTFQSYPYTCCEACSLLMNYPLILGSVTWWPLYFISHDTWLEGQVLILDYHVEPCAVNNKKRILKGSEPRTSHGGFNKCHHSLFRTWIISRNDGGFPLGEREGWGGLLQTLIWYNYMGESHL